MSEILHTKLYFDLAKYFAVTYVLQVVLLINKSITSICLMSDNLSYLILFYIALLLYSKVFGVRKMTYSPVCSTCNCKSVKHGTHLSE